jgi:hypothetical protein
MMSVSVRRKSIRGVFVQPRCQIVVSVKVEQRFAKLLKLLKRQRTDTRLRLSIHFANPAAK